MKKHEFKCVTLSFYVFDKQIHWWKSVGFKKDSLFSTEKQKGSKVKGHMGEKGLE